MELTRCVRFSSWKSSASPSLRAICWKRSRERIKKWSKMLIFDLFLTGSRLDKIKISPIGPAPSKVTWNWPAECDFRVGKGSRLPRLKLSAENAPEKQAKSGQKSSFLTSFWLFLDSGSLAECRERAEPILRHRLYRMRLKSWNFFLSPKSRKIYRGTNHGLNIRGQNWKFADQAETKEARLEFTR